MPARRKCRSDTGKPAGSMIWADHIEAGAQAQNCPGVLGDVGLEKRNLHDVTALRGAHEMSE